MPPAGRATPLTPSPGAAQSQPVPAHDGSEIFKIEDMPLEVDSPEPAYAPPPAQDGSQKDEPASPAYFAVRGRPTATLPGQSHCISMQWAIARGGLAGWRLVRAWHRC